MRVRVRLHDFRPIIMINSFHLTRTSQASLGAFRNTRNTRKKFSQMDLRATGNFRAGLMCIQQIWSAGPATTPTGAGENAPDVIKRKQTVMAFGTEGG